HVHPCHPATHSLSTLFPYTTLSRSRFRRLPQALGLLPRAEGEALALPDRPRVPAELPLTPAAPRMEGCAPQAPRDGRGAGPARANRKSTRLNSSHVKISYAVFCLKK